MQARACVACISSKYFSVEIDISDFSDVVVLIVVVVVVVVDVVVVVEDLTDKRDGALVTHGASVTANSKVKNNFGEKLIFSFLKLFELSNELLLELVILCWWFVD